MRKEALQAAKDAFSIEEACIREMKEFFDEEAFAAAVALLAKAPRIGASGCGHSGIVCQHFVHLMCCIERPARFISPAEAVHGGSGFLQKGDVMLFVSRGGKTKELLPIADICKRKGVSIITITENMESELAGCAAGGPDRGNRLSVAAVRPDSSGRRRRGAAESITVKTDSRGKDKT